MAKYKWKKKRKRQEQIQLTSEVNRINTLAIKETIWNALSQYIGEPLNARNQAIINQTLSDITQGLNYPSLQVNFNGSTITITGFLE